MEEDIKKQLIAQDELLNKIYKSVESTRKYFMWTLIITLVLFILPLIGILVILPSFISDYSSALGGF